MNVKLLIKQHIEFLSLKGGCTGSSESIYIKMPNCWKSHATAHIYNSWGPCICEDILVRMFFLCFIFQAYAAEFRQLAPIISKFISFLHQFVTYSSQRATNILKNHVELLG